MCSVGRFLLLQLVHATQLHSNMLLHSNLDINNLRGPLPQTFGNFAALKKLCVLCPVNVIHVDDARGGGC